MKNIVITFGVLLFSININAQVKDIDGNEYETIIVDGKKWATKNLNTDRFNNGEFIDQAYSEKEWKKFLKKKKPAFCYYNFDNKNGKKYGKLYNWYVIADDRALAPEGWHVATDKEWKALIEKFGGIEEAGKALKTKSGWDENQQNSNSSNFSAIPGGYTVDGSKFENHGCYGYWWSSTEAMMTNAYSYSMYCLDNTIKRKVNYKYSGLSIRFVRD